MVNSINVNNNYPVSNSGIKQEDIQKTIAKSKQAVNENLENNSAVQVLSNSVGKDNSMLEKMIIFPVLYFMDKAIDNKIGGTGGNNLFQKIANVGDSISHFLHLDNILSSSNLENISKFIKNNRLTKYFTNDYKAIAKSSSAKMPTMAEQYSGELVSYIRDNIIKLNKNKEFIAEIESKAASLSDDTVNLIKNMAEDSNYTIEQITKIAEKLAKSDIKGIDSKNLAQLLNKFKAANSQFGQTFLGKILAKGALKTKNIVTYGGFKGDGPLSSLFSLVNLYFASNAIFEAFKAAKEAPKGEKKSAFMHVLSEQYIGILLFQPSINLLYKFGGNKYRGMTVEGRNALKELISKTNMDENLTKEAYKVAKLQKDLLLKGVSKDKVQQLAGKSLKEAKTLFKSLKNQGAKIKLWERPLKFFGKLLDTGLDTLKSPSILGKMGNKLKGFAGGAARFILILMVIQPIIQKPVTKLVHKIFGEPKEYLAKKNQENKSESDSSKPIDEKSKTQNSPKQDGGTNLLNLYTKDTNSVDKNGQNVQTQISEQQQTQFQAQSPSQAKAQEALPAFNLFKKKDDNEEYSGYIPDIKVDTSYESDREKEIEKQVNAALKRTDKLVKETKKMLN